MRILFLVAAMAAAALAFSSCASSFSLPPIRARACYIAPDGTAICAGADAKGIVLDAQFDRRADPETSLRE